MSKLRLSKDDRLALANHITALEALAFLTDQTRLESCPPKEQRADRKRALNVASIMDHGDVIRVIQTIMRHP